jgi:hypothetical protein
MKKIFLLFTALFVGTYLAQAQAPQGINYQGVARNASGQAIGMQAIALRFTILQSGSPVYIETHSATTDTFGLYSKVIGQGTAQMGTFGAINWALGNYSLQVEIDPGTGYQTVGTLSMMSVPYALYAENAGNSSGGTVTSISAGPGLTSTPNPITSAGTIDLPAMGTAGTYGSASAIPTITLDNYGRVTSVTTSTISAANVQGVTGTAPISIGGTPQVPDVSIPAAGLTSDGYLTMSDWNLFNNKVSSITTGTGILGNVIGTTYTLTADNTNAIWNANQIQGIGVSAGPLNVNDVLKFNGTTWAPAPIGGLPAPSVGSLLFTDATNTWQATNPAAVSSDGNSITVVNTTTLGTAGTFVTNNSSAGSVPALKAESNSSTGYALWANNTSGAAILATSPGPYALTGDLSFGGGNAVVGRLLNSSSGNAVLGQVDATSLGSAGAFYNLNTSNDSATLFSYTNGKGPAIFALTQGPGNAAGFGIDNAASNGAAILASTNGGGKALWAINQGMGYAGGFLITNPNNDSAAVAAYTVGKGIGVASVNAGSGSAGDFQVWNPANNKPALNVATSGTGFSGKFFGGAGVQIDNLQVQDTLNIPLNANPGFVLTSDATGNALWMAPNGGLPAGSLGQVLYHNGSNWLGSNTSSLVFNGTQLGIGTASPAADLEVVSAGVGFQSVNTTGAAYAIKGLQLGSNSQAGYFEILNTGNTADALYAQTNGSGNAIKGYTNGFGAGVIGINGNNGGGGYAVYGLSTGFGNAGKFDVQNTGSGANALEASTTGTGYSGMFSGGAGVYADKVEITNGMRYTAGVPALGKVLTSDAVGNVSWQPVPGGVTSVSTNTTLVNTGTATAPNLSLNTTPVTAGTYGSSTTIPQITVDTYGRITNATNMTPSGLLPAGANGQMLYNSSGAWVTSNTANLFFNGTSMGIGNASPVATLDIAASNTLAAVNVVNSAASGKAVSGRHTGNGSYGLFGEATGSLGSAGVYGFASNASGTNNYGVAGFNQNPSSGYGVFGQGLYGVQGQTNSSTGYGVYGVANIAGATGVAGIASQTSGKAGDFQVSNATNPSTALAAATAGSGPAGTFNISAATNSSAALIAGTSGTGPAVQSNGRVLVSSDANSKIYIQGSSTAAPTLLVMRSNGTIAVPSAPFAGYDLGTIGFTGYNGSSFGTTSVAGMRASTAQTFSGAAMGTDLYFQTTSIGSTTASDRMVIDRTGSVGIGVAGPLQLFDVANKFLVTNTGNIVRINNVTTSFPSTQGVAGSVLQNDGSGNLTWAAPNLTAWSPSGNTGTVDGVNFIGNTDDVPLTIRVKNVRAGRISNSTGNSTSFGYEALANGAGSYNTAVGHQALWNPTSGSSNTAMGYYALKGITNGMRNTAIGENAMRDNNSGSNNTAVGQGAMIVNQGGSNNVAMGIDALNGNTSGNGNTAIGYTSLSTVMTTSANTGVGYGSIWNSSGSNNSSLGYLALSDLGPGSNNAGVGYKSGTNGYYGNNNTYLGANTGHSVNTMTVTGSTAIGYNAKVDQDNSIVLGATGVNVGIGTSTPGAQLDIGPTASSLSLRVTNTSTVAATAGYFNNSSSSNGGSVLASVANGSGPAGDFKVNNGASSASAVVATTNGSGSGINATSSGSGYSAQFSGGSGMKTDGFTAAVKTAISGANTLTLTDYFFLIPAGIGGSVTLPSPIGASMVGKIYVLKNLGGAAYLLGGGSTYTSATGVSGQGSIPANSVIRLISDGSNWQAW